MKKKKHNYCIYTARDKCYKPGYVQFNKKCPYNNDKEEYENCPGFKK